MPAVQSHNNQYKRFSTALNISPQQAGRIGPTTVTRIRQLVIVYPGSESTQLITILRGRQSVVMRNIAPEEDRLAVFAAAIVTHDDGPDECTIYPEDVTPHRRQSTWITAKADAFCDAADQR